MSRPILAVAFALAAASALPAQAQDFPFGLEMTLDARPMSGSKRLPTLEIGDAGEVRWELWCKGGRGQFSVAGPSVIFVAGPAAERACAPDRAAADDALLEALGKVETWRRQGDIVTLVGPQPLRFRINTN